MNTQEVISYLDEDINKSNFRATIERLGIANNNSRLFNPVQIGNLNLCANSVSNDELDEELNENIINSEPTIIEFSPKENKTRDNSPFSQIRIDSRTNC